MTKPKFKEGDRVEILSTPRKEDELGCVHPMETMIGKVYTIEDMHPPDCSYSRTCYDIGGWVWWGYNLRLVEEEADG